MAEGLSGAAHRRIGGIGCARRRRDGTERREKRNPAPEIRPLVAALNPGRRCRVQSWPAVPAGVGGAGARATNSRADQATQRFGCSRLWLEWKRWPVFSGGRT